MATEIERCLHHKPLQLGYLAWHAEAERRSRRGIKQRQCPDCAKWMWRDEYGPGWAAANTQERSERAGKQYTMDLNTFNTLYKRERHPGVYKDFIDDLKIDTPTKFSTYPNGQAAYNAKKGLQNAARKLDIRTRILVLRNRPEWEVWAVRDGPRAK